MAVTTNTVTKPDPLWLRVYREVSPLGYPFFTGGGWWTECRVLLWLGAVAEPVSAWLVGCGCLEVEPRPACCTDGKNGWPECQPQGCKHLDVSPHERQIDLPARVQKFWDAPRSPVRWAGRQRIAYPDGTVYEVMRCAREDRPDLRVQARYLEAIRKYSQPDTWAVADLPGLIAFREGRPVAAVMAMAMAPDLEKTGAVITSLPDPEGELR